MRDVKYKPCVVLTTSDGTARDVTLLCNKITWEGDIDTASRELSLEFLRKDDVNASPGDAVTLAVGGSPKFLGIVVRVDRNADSRKISVRCFDFGRIIKNCKAIYQFRNTTPEAATARICKENEIEVGEIATTGFTFSRNFINVSLFDIIFTCYTLASNSNGKKYYAYFDGQGKFNVKEKALGSTYIRLMPRENLMELSVSESIEKIVNKVVIYDKENNIINTLEDAESRKAYGTITNMIKDGDEAQKKAEAELRDGKPTQKVTCQNLGNLECISGSVVTIREQDTGLEGEFFIDADVHTWTRGQYYNKLTLNFQNIMNEKTSGTEEK